MGAIAQAVMAAIGRDRVDSEWRENSEMGEQFGTIHRRNECFAGAANDSARNDFYVMWTPEYTKAKNR